ncbi:MAG: tetratricopeptide repeat protein [Isosphaeraceae bacterium]|nr:tetratricopeptide repeat protein [Isosphaeraceae bacterium]
MGTDLVLGREAGNARELGDSSLSPESTPEPAAEPVARVGSWLALLVALQMSPWVAQEIIGLRMRYLPPTGAARLVAYPFSWSELSRGLWFAWPLLLALGLWRLRWARLGRAAALALLVLALGPVLDGAVRLIPSGGRRPVGPWPWASAPPPAAIATTAHGAAQMIAELIVAGCAWRVDRCLSVPARLPAERPARRQAMLGRLAVVGSLVFALVALGVRIWDGYLRVLSAYPLVRTSILKFDQMYLARERERARDDDPRSPAERLAEEQLWEAAALRSRGHYREARRTYFHALVLLERLAREERSRGPYRRALAQQENNLAWFLATCPHPEVRSPAKAVELARKAIAFDPREGNTWNTLGAALYRAGDLPAADDALIRAMRLRAGGDSYDWFFLAMIRWRTGDREQAEHLYDRALAWWQANRPGDPELYRLAVEAAEQLDREPPPMPEPLRERRGRWRGPGPGAISVRSWGPPPSPRPIGKERRPADP